MKIFLLLLAALSVSPLSAQPTWVQEPYSIDSEYLEEERQYWVHLPDSYFEEQAAAKTYPVIYLLDARAQFLALTGTLHSMSSGLNGNYRIPEAIVVGIPNADRVRDFTPNQANTEELGEEFANSGGAGKFLDFIEHELVPRIESDYRVIEHRTLVGHSLGGLLGITSLVERPELFDAYLIIDPSLWWNDLELLDQLEDKLELSLNSDTAVYIVTPEYSERNQQITSTSAFHELLLAKQDGNLRVELQRIAGVSHGSVPLPAYSYGLPFVFGDFEIDFEQLLAQGPDYVATHFRVLSQRLGVKYLPPEALIEAIAKNTSGLPPDMRQISTRFFEYAVQTYPESHRAYYNLASSYFDSDQVDAAVTAYRKVLELDPSNTEVRTILNSIGTDIN